MDSYASCFKEGFLGMFKILLQGIETSLKLSQAKLGIWLLE